MDSGNNILKSFAGNLQNILVRIVWREKYFILTLFCDFYIYLFLRFSEWFYEHCDN